MNAPYYKNFLWLFTDPQKAYKRFSKDGLKKSLQVLITVTVMATIIQYAFLILSGEFDFSANWYYLLANLPIILILSTAISILTLFLTSYLSAASLKVFFKKKNEWKKAFTLLNYSIILSYAFLIPINLAGYLPFSVNFAGQVALSEIAISAFSVISMILTLRAAGEALKLSCKATFTQGIITYFLINFTISIIIAQVSGFLFLA